MPTERRLAAILAADVVGYSRLMGVDEVGTLQAVKAMRGAVLEPLIGGHRGRIVKTTGDGFLVEFASVVDAVSCAVAIQRQLDLFPARATASGALTLRIGVNIGDIIIDGADIFGDGVNVASRLESICEPGGVTVSRAVHEQIRDKLAFPFVDLGERMVKNIARPVQVFELSSEAIAGRPMRQEREAERDVMAPPRSPIRPVPAQPAPPPVPQSALPPPLRSAEPEADDDEGDEVSPRSTLKVWRRRLILIAVAVFVLSRIGPVRHAVYQFVAWVETKRADSVPAKPVPAKPAPANPTATRPASLSPPPAAPSQGANPPAANPPAVNPVAPNPPVANPAPASQPPVTPSAGSEAPPSQAPGKPGQLAPLPPPILVPSTPGNPPDTAEAPDKPLAPPIELHPQD